MKTLMSDPRMTPFFSLSIPMVIAVAILASPLRADTVSIRPAGEAATDSPTVYNDVKITNIRQGVIAFSTLSGNVVNKELSSVVGMTIEDEPQFNLAQQDYAANHLDRAIDEFDQTIQKTDKAWLKTYCMPFMTDAANKAGRFDKAVDGYISLVMNQPGAAAQHRPIIPKSGSQYLDGAAQALDAAVDVAGISSPQQNALLSLLLEVDRARNDTASVDSVASRLAKIAGDSGPNAGMASLALADAKLTEANSALQQKDYDKAAAIINGSGQLFQDSQRQADALFILAQARAGQAQAKNDPDAWRDAAIAYMRVDADFKDDPGSPHVAASLLKCASILENHLNQPGKAMRMYQSITTQFPRTTAAQEAAQQTDRLKSAGVRPE